MARQSFKPGIAPSGVGGDTNRSANTKWEANFTELYKAMGAVLNSANSGAEGAVLPATGLPIANGGTGATTAVNARTNLGLGTAAAATLTTSNQDATFGRVLKVGDYGLGSNVINTPDISANTPAQTPGGFVRRGTSGYLSIPINNIYPDNKILLGQGAGGLAYLTASPINASTFTEYSIRTGKNTTVDPNGFIKNASPIVNLYADKIETNDEAQQQNITFEKLGVGDYLIKGSSGFAQEGWYVEQPKDSNGNIYHAVVYETLENGDISVKTYEQKMDGVKVVPDLDKPIDVKENRFITLRLQELPQPEGQEPQPDPTIVDNEGNPAPSRYHTLEGGKWVISNENAALLENARLMTMPALTRRQFRMVLVMNGFNLDDIEALINAIEDPMQQQLTRIEWQDSNTFERANPSLLVMAELMQLSTEQVDQLWSQALTL